VYLATALITTASVVSVLLPKEYKNIFNKEIIKATGKKKLKE
jgi:hypothetical protein